MKVARVFVSGFVQGVGYRQFVKKNAEKLGVTGFVKNLPDGRVEAMLQGSKENIEEMIKLFKKGPFLSEVEDVDVFWEKIDEKFEGFKIGSGLQ